MGKAVVQPSDLPGRGQFEQRLAAEADRRLCNTGPGRCHRVDGRPSGAVRDPLGDAHQCGQIAPGQIGCYRQMVHAGPEGHPESAADDSGSGVHMDG